MTHSSSSRGGRARPAVGRITASASQTAARLLTRLPAPARSAVRLARKGVGAVLDTTAASMGADDLRPGPDDGRFPVVVHFAGDADSSYQLTQWLWPLEQLARNLPVIILCRNARTARDVADLTELPVRFGRRLADLDAAVGGDAVRCVLYMNQSPQNFHALRYARPVHVHLSHGESEKSSMVTNQLKAYDRVFTAGQAARDRISTQLIEFSDDRMIDVGRPQLDAPAPVPEEWREYIAGGGESTAAPTVFWAPTWEGDSPAMAYGTLPQSGIAIAEALVTAGARVIYRPHPRTGVADPLFRAADTAVRTRIAASGGFIDSTASVGWQFVEADACITEMSSVAFDWLTTGKPLALIRPNDARAETIPGGLLDRVPAVAPDHAAEAVTALVKAIASPDSTALGGVAHHYLGDTAPGSQIERFIGAIMTVVDQREKALRAHD